MSGQILFVFFVVHDVNSDKMDINDLMQYGYLELRYIIDWARKVPGRLKLPDL